jgi:hypothetical protein
MPIRQSQFDTLLTPAIYHHFDLGVQQIPSLRARLFNIQGSTLSQEKGAGIGATSPDAWNVYSQSGDKGELDFSQLYTATYTHVEYPVRMRIEKKLMSNDQYGVIGSYARRAGMSAESKMEIDAASLLNNAFSSTLQPGPDAVALSSASHPQSPNDSSSVLNNTGTSALTKKAVSDTRIAMMQFEDDRGSRIGVMPDELWVPPELEDTALEIVKSVLDPTSGNNAANAQAGRWTVVPWMRLTGAKAWFMVSSAWRRELVNWYNREATQVMLVDEDTTHLTYEFKLHYSFGFDDWRWVYGHNPS